MKKGCFELAKFHFEVSGTMMNGFKLHTNLLESDFASVLYQSVLKNTAISIATVRNDAAWPYFKHFCAHNHFVTVPPGDKVADVYELFCQFDISSGKRKTELLVYSINSANVFEKIEGEYGRMLPRFP